MTAQFFVAFGVTLQVGALQRILEVNLVGVLGVIVLRAVKIHQVLDQLVVELELLVVGLLAGLPVLAEHNVFTEEILGIIVAQKLLALFQQVEGLSGGNVAVSNRLLVFLGLQVEGSDEFLQQFCQNRGNLSKGFLIDRLFFIFGEVEIGSYLVVYLQQSAECLEVVIVDLVVEFEVRLVHFALLLVLLALNLKTSTSSCKFTNSGLEFIDDCSFGFQGFIGFVETQLQFIFFIANLEYFPRLFGCLAFNSLVLLFATLLSFHVFLVLLTEILKITLKFGKLFILCCNLILKPVFLIDDAPPLRPLHLQLFFVIFDDLLELHLVFYLQLLVVLLVFLFLFFFGFLEIVAHLLKFPDSELQFFLFVFCLLHSLCVFIDLMEIISKFCLQFSIGLLLVFQLYEAGLQLIFVLFLFLEFAQYFGLPLNLQFVVGFLELYHHLCMFFLDFLKQKLIVLRLFFISSVLLHQLSLFSSPFLLLLLDLLGQHGNMFDVLFFLPLHAFLYIEKVYLGHSLLLNGLLQRFLQLPDLQIEVKMRYFCCVFGLEKVPEDTVIIDPSLELIFQNLDSFLILFFLFAAIFIGREIMRIGSDGIVVAFFPPFGQWKDLAGSILAFQFELAE